MLSTLILNDTWRVNFTGLVGEIAGYSTLQNLEIKDITESISISLWLFFRMKPKSETL